MKVLHDSHGECMLACNEPWLSGNQAGMSKQGNSPDYEYWRLLREHEVRSS